MPLVRDLGGLISQMEEDQTISRIARNPLAQFGTPNRRYLAATILPEVLQDQNAYREEKVQYRTIIANHGPRYSPVQIKAGAMSGWVDVILYHSDKGDMLTSREYDVVTRFLRQRRPMEAVASLIRFVDRGLVLPLKERNEKDRWDCLFNDQVVLTGDGGYSETISYPQPSGHRVAAANVWGDDTYDPFDDIYAMDDMLVAKGLKTARMITSKNVINILAKNAKVQARANRITISGGSITAINSRVSLEQINAALALDGLPPFELFDMQYRTQTGTARFTPNDAILGIAATGRDQELDLGDRMEILPNTLGYTGIGTPAGQADPGPVVFLNPETRRKPPHIAGESWQTAAPVVTEPEGKWVLHSISGAES